MNEVSKLYLSIAKDLRIPRFSTENDMEYHFRLVYSAIGAWVLNLASDRDIEDIDLRQVSRAHVTNSALTILHSFLDLDSDMNIYFHSTKPSADDSWKLSLIQNIMSCYINLGYFDSGNYALHETYDYQRVSTSDGYDLTIDNSRVSDKMVGLGRYNVREESAVSLQTFLPGKASAVSVFKVLINTINFHYFSYELLGKIEIYDLDYHKWTLYDENIAYKYDYSLLRVDDIDFAILKKHNGQLMISMLSEIYCKRQKNPYYYREEWRVLLGMAMYLNKPFKVVLKPHFNDGLKIDFKNINFLSLPSKEENLLRAMTWPFEHCFDNLQMVTYKSFEKSLLEVFDRLSIQVIKEE